MKDINEAKTFRKIINAHENFVTRLHTCLLLDRQLHQISKTLFGMFDTAIQVAHTSVLSEQMEKLHNVILESNIGVLHLHPTDPEKLTGAPINEIEKFKDLTQSFVK